MSDLKNIQKELLEISPRLGKALDKKDGYLLPKGCFAQLENEVKSSLKTEEYSVPGGYFENLETAIKNGLKKQDKKRTIQRRMWPKLAALAASVVLITFVLTREPIGSNQTVSEELGMDFSFLEDEIDELGVEDLVMLIEEDINLELLEDEDLEEYLETVILDLDESDLIDLIN